NDQHAVVVLQACRLSGLRVPEELAVLGIHDDALYCHLGHVPLSSIAIAGEKMGYEAARLLDMQLQGEPIVHGHLDIAPLGVITRRSTDALAVEDPHIQEALHWISAHLHEEIDLEDLLDAVPMSRSSLERRFKQMLGRTPYEEVLRQRIERARTLLVDTDLTMEQIALECGFSGRVYFGNAFKHRMKISPAAYRAQYARPGTWR
ncbi:MAG: helix-turn-helix domain-containing protein, partial [Phycisphaerales bacterium]|nr:helix-turn-helix domain-containing protein [Phycisphaerales bacterium]